MLDYIDWETLEVCMKGLGQFTWLFFSMQQYLFCEEHLYKFFFLLTFHRTLRFPKVLECFRSETKFLLRHSRTWFLSLNFIDWMFSFGNWVHNCSQVCEKSVLSGKGFAFQFALEPLLNSLWRPFSSRDLIIASQKNIYRSYIHTSLRV